MISQNDTISISVAKALEFATHKHYNQKRKDALQTSYIVHPIHVMSMLVNAGERNSDILCAALLHDTIEDTKTSPEEIRKEFGSSVESIVLECTDDKSLTKSQRKRKQLAHAHEISISAAKIKLCDKYDNCGSLSTDPPASWSDEQVTGYLTWSYAVCQALRRFEEKSDVVARLFKQIDALFDQYDLSPNKIDEQQLGNRLATYYRYLEKQEAEEEKKQKQENQKK